MAYELRLLAVKVQKASPRQLGGVPGAVLAGECRIATEKFVAGLRKKAEAHGLAIGGYREDCYCNGSQVFVVTDRTRHDACEDVAALIEEHFGSVVPSGWQFYIDFVIPKGFETDGTPLLEGVFSETYEADSSV